MRNQHLTEQGLGNFIPLKIVAIEAALVRAAYTLRIYTFSYC